LRNADERATNGFTLIAEVTPLTGRRLYEAARNVWQIYCPQPMLLSDGSFIILIPIRQCYILYNERNPSLKSCTRGHDPHPQPPVYPQKPIKARNHVKRCLFILFVSAIRGTYPNHISRNKYDVNKRRINNYFGFQPNQRPSVVRIASPTPPTISSLHNMAVSQSISGLRGNGISASKPNSASDPSGAIAGADLAGQSIATWRN